MKALESASEAEVDAHHKSQSLVVNWTWQHPRPRVPPPPVGAECSATLPAPPHLLLAPKIVRPRALPQVQSKVDPVEAAPAAEDGGPVQADHSPVSRPRRSRAPAARRQSLTDQHGEGIRSDPTHPSHPSPYGYAYTETSLGMIFFCTLFGSSEMINTNMSTE